MQRDHGSARGCRAQHSRLHRAAHPRSREPGRARRDELIASAERLLAEAQAALPRAFGRLPSVPVGRQSRRVLSASATRRPPTTFRPAPDGSRPATFYINTFEPRSRPRHTLPALAFHEGVPGHHLQIALAQEAADLPRFRRLSAGWLSNAFVEGWALYTERLADELGLYPDDLARFGMLGYQAWRACRLVVDTGLHHLRWSRQQAVEFFFDNVGLTERETINEVDRYIVWPGQALAYKIGQREIEAVRRSMQDAARRGALISLRSTMPCWPTPRCRSRRCRCWSGPIRPDRRTERVDSVDAARSGRAADGPATTRSPGRIRWVGRRR